MEPDLSGQLRLRSMSRFSNYSSECGDDLNSPKHHCSDAPARQFGQKLSLLHPLWPFLDSRARNSVSLNSNNQSMTGEVDGHRPRSYSACHHIPTDNPCDSPRATANEIWKDREDQKAERLANWAAFDDSSGQICKRSPSVWSRLVPNGVAAHNGSANHSKSTTYGSMGEKKEGKRGDKWTNTIKQLQKHKKMAGRNRAKKIDQKSRWVFPATFIIFNILYWGYYCLY
ncbi:unnamed protein product, partial [Mesorhabditis belari]|uniref:Uncharacterized protein n=1 Tax=Mesorhabditis belari TaxID=2138241 RepID=A0AAF3F379_9BILA